MLKLVNISKKYQDNEVLKNINIDFKTKELVFILGPSGSGKSTLLNIIGDILKPDTGLVYLDNMCLSKYNKRKIDDYHKNTVSYIFQEYNLIEYMTVIDNLKLLKNNITNSEIDKVLEKLDILKLKNTKVFKLSGGEKQRVAIARSILKDSSILLCDEPTGALDSINGIKVMEILKKISKDKLVIVVSHDINLAHIYADRIIEIKDGIVDYTPVSDNDKFNISKNIKFKHLGKISIKNLLLNKKRTILTSIASSIGIFCLLLVLGLSLGFNKEINDLENKIVTIFPITIENIEYNLEKDIKSSKDKIIIKDESNYVYKNNITYDYIDYLKNIKEIKYIKYDYNIDISLITDSNKQIDNIYFESIPSKKYIIDNYKIIYGRNIENNHEILLQIDSYNNLSSNISNSFNINEDIEYKDIIGRKIIIDSNNIELTIVGIIKEKEIAYDTSNLIYDSSLTDELIESKEIPSKISIYFDNLKNKEKVINSLEEYNKKNNKIIYEDNMQETINIVKDFTNIITIVLVVFSVISLLISSIMISILTGTRVLERKKEIGILRSMGASKRNVTNIFNIENLIISMISSLLAIILAFIIKKPLNIFLYNYLDSSNIFKLDINILIPVILFNTFLAILSGLLPAIRASKLEIIKCIKN